MNAMTSPTWPEHLMVVVIVATGVYAILRAHPAMKAARYDTATKIATYWTNGAVLVAGAAAVVAAWWRAGRDLGDLGLRVGEVGPAAIALTVGFLLCYAGDIWWRLSGPRRARTIERGLRDVPFIPETFREYRHFAVLGATAGVTEEILFRGFLISYVVALLGDSIPAVAVAIVVPALAFAIAHRYQDAHSVRFIAGLAIVFGAITVLTGSVLIPIVLHVVVNLTSGAIALRVGREFRPDGELGPARPTGSA